MNYFKLLELFQQAVRSNDFNFLKSVHRKVLKEDLHDKYIEYNLMRTILEEKLGGFIQEESTTVYDESSTQIKKSFAAPAAFGRPWHVLPDYVTHESIRISDLNNIKFVKQMNGLNETQLIFCLDASKFLLHEYFYRFGADPWTGSFLVVILSNLYSPIL
jgi:hypothetical protein